MSNARSITAENSYATVKKISYYAGIIDNVVTRDINHIIKLQDSTGDIDACIDYSFIKRHPRVIEAGRVLLLVNCSVITNTKRRMSLIITSNNIWKIISDTETIFLNNDAYKEPVDSGAYIIDDDISQAFFNDDV